MSQDLYAILGVTRSATGTEIKKAYFRLAIIFHPDKNKDGVERFKEISHAYSVLSDPEKRRAHDLKVPASSSNGARAYSTYTQYTQEFFNTPPPPPKPQPQPRAQPRQQPAQPPPPPPPPPAPKKSDYNIRSSVNISLKEAYIGAGRVSVQYKEDYDCETCHGQVNLTKRTKTCEHCEGSGKIERTVKQKMHVTTCAFCQGKGHSVFFLNCQSCKGKKTINQTLKIRVPKGVHNGHALQVKDKGNLMPDGKTRGDIILRVNTSNESEDGIFVRQGDHLHIVVEVCLKEAIMGFQQKVLCKHMDGRIITATQPYGSVIQPNSSKVIKGEGMPIFNSKEDKRGDLNIKFEVVFPKTVNIPQSPSDKKVIDLLFETPEERKAKENVIVIDDDEMDEVEVVQPPSKSHHSSRSTADKNVLQDLPPAPPSPKNSSSNYNQEEDQDDGYVGSTKRQETIHDLFAKLFKNHGSGWNHDYDGLDKDENYDM